MIFAVDWALNINQPVNQSEGMKHRSHRTEQWRMTIKSRNMNNYDARLLRIEFLKRELIPMSTYKNSYTKCMSHSAYVVETQFINATVRFSVHDTRHVMYEEDWIKWGWMKHKGRHYKGRIFGNMQNMRNLLSCNSSSVCFTQQIRLSSSTYDTVLPAAEPLYMSKKKRKKSALPGCCL